LVKVYPEDKKLKAEVRVKYASGFLTATSMKG